MTEAEVFAHDGFVVLRGTLDDMFVEKCHVAAMSNFHKCLVSGVLKYDIRRLSHRVIIGADQ